MCFIFHGSVIIHMCSKLFSEINIITPSYTVGKCIHLLKVLILELYLRNLRGTIQDTNYTLSENAPPMVFYINNVLLAEFTALCPRHPQISLYRPGFFKICWPNAVIYDHCMI